MFAIYKNCLFLANVTDTHVTLITFNCDKAEMLTDCIGKRDYFKKTIDISDPQLVAVYDIHFSVKYKDPSEKQTAWLVDPNRTVGLSPDLKNNIVVIDIPHDAADKSWTQYDKGASAKRIHLENCSEFIITTIYTKKDGEYVGSQSEITTVPLNTFKQLIVEHQKETL